MEKELKSDLYFSVKLLSQILSGLANDEFKTLGLAPSYAYLLMTVNSRPGIQPSELSKILGLKPSTITRLVEKMEYRGYLERVSKGRATEVEPTAKSRAKDPEIREVWGQLKERYTAILGERYTRVLTEMSSEAVEQLGNE